MSAQDDRENNYLGQMKTVKGQIEKQMKISCNFT